MKTTFSEVVQKKHTIETHNQSHNVVERVVQVVKSRFSYFLELCNAPKEH